MLAFSRRICCVQQSRFFFFQNVFAFYFILYARIFCKTDKPYCTIIVHESSFWIEKFCFFLFLKTKSAAYELTLWRRHENNRVSSSISSMSLLLLLFISENLVSCRAVHYSLLVYNTVDTLRGNEKRGITHST